MTGNDDIIEFPIDGVLDLHTFSPKEIEPLLEDYLEECRRRGILEVRIIHGKGKGVQRRRVLAWLEGRPEIAAVTQAPPQRGGWGATIVHLKP